MVEKKKLKVLIEREITFMKISVICCLFLVIIFAIPATRLSKIPDIFGILLIVFLFFSRVILWGPALFGITKEIEEIDPKVNRLYRWYFLPICLVCLVILLLGLLEVFELKYWLSWAFLFVLVIQLFRIYILKRYEKKI